MNMKEVTDDKLNMFIDQQLDADEMNQIHEMLLEDNTLRERICQLKAVRELVGYAYTEVPPSTRQQRECENARFSIMPRAMVASFLLFAGVLVGWFTYQLSPVASDPVNAENAFQYVANHAVPDHDQRRIVLHIDSGDVKVVNSALREADHLIETYRKANVPMKLDIVTNKNGINILREDISPYIGRIQKMISEDGVEFYACMRSVQKAKKKERKDIDLIPGVKSDKTAREIIPERIERGWVYIKA